MHVHVGTSGYNYPEWKGTFYPADIKPPKMFAYYAERFHTVEINYTFYRMPTVKLTGGWRDQAPGGFAYTLKAPRRLTHEKKLKDCAADVGYFVEAARVLGDRLGTLLFQLPPTFRADTERLREFLALLPRDLRCAFEFRHDSWLSEETYAALESHAAALCVADFGDKTTPLRPTARFGYFRLRDEGYQQPDLERWASQVEAQASVWDDAFVYFKHEDEGKGPEFAKAFLDILARRGIRTT
jgi:uncharacterized protein YecE (DUF72 family)